MSGAGLHPRVSVNLVSGWNWSLGEHLAFLPGIGARAVSLTGRHMADGAAQALHTAGLSVASLGTGVGSLVDGAEAASAALAPWIDAAVELASPVLFTVTGPTPPRMPTGEACDRLAASLAPAGRAARARGVTLAIEPSSPALRSHGFVCSLADACSVAAEAEVAVVVETQNCWYERDLPRLFRAHAGRIAIVQCSDFAVGEELRMNRRVPGDGDIPLEWTIGDLLDAGYRGMFDLELVGPAIETEGYAEAIRRGADWLSERLARLGA